MAYLRFLQEFFAYFGTFKYIFLSVLEHKKLSFIMKHQRNPVTSQKKKERTYGKKTKETNSVRPVPGPQVVSPTSTDALLTSECPTSKACR